MLLSTSVTEEELPDTAPGPQSRPSESASAPRRGTPNSDVFRKNRKTNPKVAIYGSPVLYPQLLNCTQQLVGGLGVPAASYPLVYSHLESGEIFASAQFRPRNQIVLLSELASPSSGPIFYRGHVTNPFGARSVSLIGDEASLL